MFGYEEDYIKRQIQSIAKGIATILGFQQNAMQVESPELQESITELLTQVDSGEINTAENRVYEMIEDNTLEHLAAALAFYNYLSEQDDAFLLAHQFSRDEVDEGIRHLGAKYGIGEQIDMFLP